MPLEGEARARAKALLHQFVMLDWDFEYIPTHAIGQGWEARIAATVEDDQGRQYNLKPQQLAILQPGQPPAIFEYAELAAEIRRENGLEPEGEHCLYCGQPLGSREGAGRDRLYCDNKGKCKVAHHRQKQREASRAATLQEYAALQAMWEEHHIDGQLLALLQNILIDQGQQAAQAATEAVLCYVREERSRQQPDIPEAPRRRKRNMTS